MGWETRTAPPRLGRAPLPQFAVFRPRRPAPKQPEPPQPPPLPPSPAVPLTQATLELPPAAFVLANPQQLPPAAVPTPPATMASGGSKTVTLTAMTTADALDADLARTATGMTGAGIKIGILSDSFDVLGGMAADITAGTLPSGVQILEEGPAGSHDEGRAMADILHSIAPDAQIVFHTATRSEADFAAGIQALQAAGCQVIVDDVAYLDEPFFQDGGEVQAAVESAVASGVSYFTAASNEGEDFVQQSFRPLHLTLPSLPPGALVQDFASAGAPQPWLDVTVPTGGQCLLDLQWDQPFASIGSDGAGSADSLGLALYDSSGNLVASAMANLTGGDPVQVLLWNNHTQSTGFRLVLFANGGQVPPGQFKLIDYGNGDLVAPATGPGIGVGSGTVIGHEMVTGANTVGAIGWSATPRYGGGDTVESFSSAGTGSFLFDAQGNPLPEPVSPDKVDFLAPDGTMTSVFAPFYGTSAAAPAAAAVAALMLQADPWLTPAQVTQLLDQSAIPVNGPASAVGAGLIQADAAVQAAWALAHAG